MESLLIAKKFLYSVVVKDPRISLLRTSMMKFSLFHEGLFFANFFIVSLKELCKESVNRQETSISPFSVFVILSLLSGNKFPPWNHHK